MDLLMGFGGIKNYNSEAQLARAITESWVAKNMYCPRCGNAKIIKIKNNRTVSYFYCKNCKSEYELKSKDGPLGNKIRDGAYETMISLITSNQNTDFLLMGYQGQYLKVKDLVIIPKHFFVPSMIEKHHSISSDAQRAGRIGCNILLQDIPRQGFIKIIDNGNIIEKSKVIEQLTISSELSVEDIEDRGWLFDVLECVNRIPEQEFSLTDIYFFEPLLAAKYPQNNNIRLKIRQQLQFLRDKGFLEFNQRGRYTKIKLK